MKKYVKPEINVELFESEDVISTSGEGTSSARYLKTVVNGNKGADYGTQEVSVFE